MPSGWLECASLTQATRALPQQPHERSLHRRGFQATGSPLIPTTILSQESGLRKAIQPLQTFVARFTFVLFLRSALQSSTLGYPPAGGKPVRLTCQGFLRTGLEKLRAESSNLRKLNLAGLVLPLPQGTTWRYPSVNWATQLHSSAAAAMSRRTTRILLIVALERTPEQSTEQDLRIVNDPSAGSPTETLLRLLLPLNDQVWSSSRQHRQCRGTAAHQSEDLTKSFNR
ncbi:hypothetical protein EAI_10632 [Harpegnathos saltator]|uniref:Uncharacterized protein n=1 Tax=Harpegnathos saltator TaxID=610380 RepID=E2C847_HARSA|nr:hypothetical protein EAI_10632 [Harpegnathos saltator]